MAEPADGSRPRILFLAHLLPWPLEGGGQIKSFHTLRLLASAYDVTLVAFIRRAEERENAAPLTPFCAGGIHLVPLPRGKLRDARVAASSLLRKRSFLIARDDVPAMHRAIAGYLDSETYAAVHIDHLQMAQFVPENISPATKIVLDEHNIEYLIPKRMTETPGLNPGARWYAAREWPRLREFEQLSCRRADRILTVSSRDADGLAEADEDIRGKMSVVPIGVDMNYWGGVHREPGARDLLSIGTMYWPPNVDSMLYFCSDILPHIRQRVPNVRLHIVGARPTAAVRALGASNPTSVLVSGSVPDVRPYGGACGVFVVPLRSGSGMRVKILNAMAMGLPVVSTTIGAEGIDVTDGEDILLADAPTRFADAVLSLLADPALAQRIGEAGRRLMRRAYSWDVIGGHLLAVYDELLRATA